MDKIQVSGITMPLDATTDEVISAAAKSAGISLSQCDGFKIAKRSVDARRKNVKLNFSVILQLKDGVKPPDSAKLLRDVPLTAPQQGSVPLRERPVIIGAGPAGLFCALRLAERGYAPIVFDRGGNVEQRIKAVEAFNSHQSLDANCNIQFGEGGAGTFSDGKLTTRINDPLCETVIDTFISCGAKQELSYDAKPHIGTDMLRDVIVNLRGKITALGGEFIFNSKLEDIKIKNGKISSVKISGNEIPCHVLVLAVGHSARDTFEMLFKRQVFMEAKSFAVGVRIEHRQAFIDESQYGDFAGHPALGAADYRLAYNGAERSCFSFCMCPGGTVVAASSEEDSVVVNGMSENARSRQNANSALVVTVTPGDFSGIMGGIDFQRKIETAAYKITSSYAAPVQNTSCFLSGTAKKQLKLTPTYPIGYTIDHIGKCLPSFVTKTLEDGLRNFDRKIPGFISNSVLTAPETRTSSPIRLTRNSAFESINTSGLYPSGEGAGYAGGIMSSAIDGIKTADALISKFSPPQNTLL